MTCTPSSFYFRSPSKATLPNYDLPRRQSHCEEERRSNRGLTSRHYNEATLSQLHNPSKHCHARSLRLPRRRNLVLSYPTRARLAMTCIPSRFYLLPASKATLPNYDLPQRQSHCEACRALSEASRSNLISSTISSGEAFPAYPILSTINYSLFTLHFSLFTLHFSLPLLHNKLICEIENSTPDNQDIGPCREFRHIHSELFSRAVMLLNQYFPCDVINSKVKSFRT